MKTHGAILELLNSAHEVLLAYVSDLSDSDLLVRPVENANHIAWQLGHLISAEHRAMSYLKAGIMRELPQKLGDYGKKKDSDSPAEFLSKQEYVDIYGAQRAGTIELLNSMSESDLDTPTVDPWSSWSPTHGGLIIGQATHQLMHAGQFVVVRRKLGKPVII